MMSREDLLRELELLPVWQLRHSSQQPSIKADVMMKDVASESIMVAQVEVAHAIEQVTETAQYSFRLIVSEDMQWVFVLGQQDHAAEQLLQNMLKAVAVNISHDIADANAAYLNQYSPKAIVVMGESEAQQLLNSTQTIEQMRGAAHSLQNIPVIVTYSPSHLLSNLADKAKAWEDLCLTKFTITSL
jgi:uracil-DNA glycosylase